MKAKYRPAAWWTSREGAEEALAKYEDYDDYEVRPLKIFSMLGFSIAEKEPQ